MYKFGFQRKYPTEYYETSWNLAFWDKNEVNIFIECDSYHCKQMWVSYISESVDMSSIIVDDVTFQNGEQIPVKF